MTMSVRDSCGYRSELHLIGTLSDYTLTPMQAVEYLHTLTIASAELNATLHELLGTNLHIYIVQALLPGMRRATSLSPALPRMNSTVSTLVPLLLTAASQYLKAPTCPLLPKL